MEDVDSTNGTELESFNFPSQRTHASMPLVSKRLYQILDGDTLIFSDTSFKCKVLSYI